MLNGVITALVTPMTKSGQIDFDSVENLVKFQIKNGIAGLVIAGSTGQGALLSHEEKLKLIHHIIKINKNKTKLIASINYTSLPESLNMIHKLNDIKGIDSLLVISPSCTLPNQEGLYNYFAAIAKASKKPIILYNHQGRSGCNIQEATLLKLAKNFKNIVGLKDCNISFNRLCYLLKHKPKNFALYSGDDSSTLGFVLCGGNGVISVSSNFIPKQMIKMVDFALKNDKVNAIKANNQIMEINHLMGIETNPIPIQYAAYHVKLIKTPNVRSPLTNLKAENQGIIKSEINKIK